VLRAWGSRNGWAPLKFEIREEKEKVKEGILTRITHCVLVPWSSGAFSNSGREEELLAAAVKRWPSHTFEGEIEFLGDDGARYRVGVRSGVAYRIEPELVWPEPPAGKEDGRG
jgi:hypothetical protein